MENKKQDTKEAIYSTNPQHEKAKNLMRLLFFIRYENLTHMAVSFILIMMD